MDPAFLAPDTARDLLEMRLVLEMGMADLLFERKTDEALGELAAMVERERSAPSPAARLEAEIGFHTALYRISRNRTLARFQALLRPFFRCFAVVPPRPGPVGHADLVGVLRDGTPAAFREAMRLHLSPHFDRLFAGNAGHDAGRSAAEPARGTSGPREVARGRARRSRPCGRPS